MGGKGNTVIDYTLENEEMRKNCENESRGQDIARS